MNRPPSPPRGFTLIEILVAMGLFTVIGLGVVMLMRTGVEMYIRGTEGSRIEDRLEQSLPRLEDDLRHVLVPAQVDRIPFDPKNPDPTEQPDPLPPSNRFLSGTHLFRLGDKEVGCRYIAFVRDTTGLSEIEMYADRAGTNAQADAFIDGKDDEQEFKERRHMPTGGAAEVLYIWLPDERRLGIGAVYRAYRSPVGGEGTLLDPGNHDSLEEVLRVVSPQPLFQNVVLFDATFWTQWTTHWEWKEREPVVTSRPTDPQQVRGPVECGPSATWDSTRGILPAEVFRLSKGADSLRRSADDIWPHSVRIAYAIAETETTLSVGFGLAEPAFTVMAGDFATGRGDLNGQSMKIGTEWVTLSGRDGRRRDTFNVRDRGARGTVKVAHAGGEPVYYGRVFDITIPIPAFRDDHN